MLFQVVTVEQCCNNMLTVLFIVGRTTLFTPVDINLQQVVDFLNFYACSPMLCQLSYAVWPDRVCDISEQNLVPSISMLSNNNHDFSVLV